MNSAKNSRAGLRYLRTPIPIAKLNQQTGDIIPAENGSLPDLDHILRKMAAELSVPYCQKP